jgi:hypothetical protein
MTDDPLAFLDSPDAEEDVLSFLDEEKPSKKLGKKTRLAAQYGIGLAERAAAPYDIAVSPLSSKKAQQVPYRENLFADIERLQEQKQMGQWDEQDQALYDSLIEQIKNPKEAEKFVQTANISSSGLLEKGAKKLGYDLEPEDLGELGARITGNLFTPKGFAKGVKQATKLFDKQAREIAKTEAKWRKINTIVKGSPEKQNILNFSKSNNLSPEATNVLLRTKGNIEVLEKLAKKSKKYKEVANELSGKLGSSYDELKNLGRKSGNLTASEAGVLEDDLTKIVGDLGETLVEGPDTKGARIAIEEAISKLDNQGATIADLINSRQNLRQVANWKNVDPKGAILEKAEKSFFRAIERKNPEIAKELKRTDEAWSKYKRFSRTLNKKEPGLRWHGLEIPKGMMSYLAFGLVPSFLGLNLPTTAKILAVKEVVQRLATKMMIDPKYHNIHKHLIHAVQTGSTKNQKSIFAVLKKMIQKDDPELYDEISDLVIE